MPLRILIAALFAVFVFSVPASALTAKQKMETCQFGATDQKLEGKARKAFISKCMANERPAKKRATAKPKQ